MTTEEICREAKRRLEEAFGERLRGVILYGSEARGEAGPDSDIDLLVLLDGPLSLLPDIDTSVAATYELVLDSGRLLDVKPVDAGSFEGQAYQFYRNARTDGRRL